MDQTPLPPLLRFFVMPTRWRRWTRRQPHSAESSQLCKWSASHSTSNQGHQKKSRVAHPRLLIGSNFCFRSVQKKTNKKTTRASMTAGLFLAHFLGKGTFGGSLLLVPICSPACTDQAALSRLCSAVFAQSVWSANEVEGKWLRFSRDTTGLFSDIDWAFYNSLSLFLSISFFLPIMMTVCLYRFDCPYLEPVLAAGDQLGCFRIKSFMYCKVNEGKKKYISVQINSVGIFKIKLHIIACHEEIIYTIYFSFVQFELDGSLVLIYVISSIIFLKLTEFSLLPLFIILPCWSINISERWRSLRGLNQKLGPCVVPNLQRYQFCCRCHSTLALKTRGSKRGFSHFWVVGWQARDTSEHWPSEFFIRWNEMSGLLQLQRITNFKSDLGIIPIQNS